MATEPRPVEIDLENKLRCGLLEMMAATVAMKKGIGSANKKVAPIANGVVVK